MNKLFKRILLFSAVSILFLIVLFLFIRIVSPRYLDDVNPFIQCDKELIEKADMLFVIPLYNNVSIADNSEWCSYIKSFNKTLALHGVYHTYHEFLTDRNESYLKAGETEFETCFGFRPNKFKPPQLKISEKNLKTMERDYTLFLRWKQIFHKSYHCSDTGLFPNWLINIV